MRQPKPVVFVAAELASANSDILPGRAGIVADKLCRLGRSFHRVAVMVANGGSDEQVSKWEKRLRSLEKQASDLCLGLGLVDRGALHISLVTTHRRRGGVFRERSTLL